MSRDEIDFIIETCKLQIICLACPNFEKSTPFSRRNRRSRGAREQIICTTRLSIDDNGKDGGQPTLFDSQRHHAFGQQSDFKAQWLSF